MKCVTGRRLVAVELCLAINYVLERLLSDSLRLERHVDYVVLLSLVARTDRLTPTRLAPSMTAAVTSLPVGVTSGY